jgi:hypothetical protein
MPGEIAVADALVPGLLLVFLASMLALWGIDWIVGRLGLYRYVWHPALFRLALFVGLFGAAGLLMFR